MIIISVDRRRKHLCCVKTDCGEYLVDIETAEIFRLKPKMTLTDGEMENILYQSELTRAKSRALWLLSMRDYSKKELVQKLAPDFNAQAVGDAVDMLEESGVVDDKRFAEYYSQELSQIRRMSRQNIRQKLMQKGIARDVIDEVVEELPDDEIPAITELIRQKYYNCFEDEKNQRRMINALIRKGYSYSDIRKAVDEYIENERNFD